MIYIVSSYRVSRYTTERKVEDYVFFYRSNAEEMFDVWTHCVSTILLGLYKNGKMAEELEHLTRKHSKDHRYTDWDLVWDKVRLGKK